MRGPGWRRNPNFDLNLPSSAKAALLVGALAARLKPCPFKTMSKQATAGGCERMRFRDACTSHSLSLLNQFVHFGLVLSLATGARRIFHHARGLGLTHTIARVGFHGLCCRKPPWLAFRHFASGTGCAGWASCVSRWQRRVWNRFCPRGRAGRSRASPAFQEEWYAGESARLPFGLVRTLDRCCGDTVFLKR